MKDQSSSPQKHQMLDGEYRLQGIHDMASAFLFNPDGTFQYMYIYGVSDRNAEGTYTIVGDTVKLKSKKEPGQDFPILSQSKKGKGYTIQVKEKNTMLLDNIVAFYFIGEVEHRAEGNWEGLIHLDEDHVDKIYLRHEIFPDIPSLIKDVTNENNYFEVGLSPTLGQVSFKGIDFVKHEDTLTCFPNYFMPFENITFVKE